MANKIIIGLGNPGEKFINTHHNAGFMAVDFFAKKNDFPEFEYNKKFNSEVSKKGKVWLAKPQTFMNESGKSAKAIFNSVKEKKENLIIIHDDIDLPLGKFKIVKERGSAGHKGVESIIRNVGNKGLIRLRIGICSTKNKPNSPEKFVVKNFMSEELILLKKVLKKISDALDFFIANGLEKTMNEYNR